MVRIWCVPVEILDRQHLLVEHFELHVVYNALLKLGRGEKAGWQRHPQTLRFIGCIGMLIDRHNQQMKEMGRRGYNHQSPLPTSNVKPETYTYSYVEQAKDYSVLVSRNGLLIEN